MKMNRKKLLILAAALVVIAAGAVFIPRLTAGNGNTLAEASQATLTKKTEVGFYLDTVITLTAYVEDAQVLKDAMAECGRYEQLLSRTVEGSDAWRINHANGEPVEVLDASDDIP